MSTETLKLQQTVAGADLRNKAVDVVRRVIEKLNGLDFGPARALVVEEQVDRLIAQASSNENLCLSYIGWCPFW